MEQLTTIFPVKIEQRKNATQFHLSKAKQPEKPIRYNKKVTRHPSDRFKR